MFPYNYNGRCLTHQKITPGNTITSVSAYCYKYCVYVLNIDAGTDVIAEGDWVVGASSGAVGKVLKIDISSGAWASDDVVAVMLIDSWNGTAWTNNEKIKVAADATCGDVNQAAAIVEASDTQYDSVYRLGYKGKLACAAHITALTQTQLLGINGGKPDQTALIGTPLKDGGELWLYDANDIANIKVVDYAAGSAGLINIDFYF